jgi:uncharacterized repeat protein (TIGR03803 family)
MGTLTRFALTISTAATALAGCGGSQPMISTPEQMSRILTTATKSFEVLHSFDGSDGEQPLSGLVDVNGTLYGTTNYGGRYGSGTVYTISTTGTERVLHSFKGGNDGANPQASLIVVKDRLYGTTSSGGGRGGPNCNGYGCGTVYSISTSGSEKVLHSFTGSGDGANPISSLLDVNGTLYGTTAGGGSAKAGTVFSIRTSGSEKVLYSFAGGSDGASPYAGLIDVNGTLYSTTAEGGSTGYGTVYSVSTSGSEKVLHSFAGSDGGNPRAGLIELRGLLYGTASAGGGSGCPPSTACGKVFRITTGGKFKVLHTFGEGSDGISPYSGLININGLLYGTTDQGGGVGCYSLGCGTVYRISTTGSEKVLHAFTGGSEGSNPQAGLVYVKGRLYGTTVLGLGSSGCSGAGCGTVFALTP